MARRITKVAIVVEDYDKAIQYYTEKLGFELIDDTPLTETKRWVVVAPKNTRGCQLLLAKASNKQQLATIGSQTGGRVFLFLETDDFWEDYQKMINSGVRFKEKPREEPYGMVVVFEDLYGNLWDLLQPGG